ncbi:MAG TPA: hypothetical protein VIA09_04330, partial [Nitrososphaeraceae archaeon]
MFRWKRKSEDPLLKSLLEKYQLNLLSIPREGARIGELYIQDPNSKSLTSPGMITNFLVPKFKITEITPNEIMAHVTGTVSSQKSGNIGLDMLEGFLRSFGLANMGPSVKAVYEASNKNGIVFSFEDPKRDSVDPIEFGAKIVKHKFMENNALYAEDRRYFVTTAIAKSSSITIEVIGDEKSSMEIDAKVTSIVEAKGGVSVEKSKTGRITFKGDRSLVFGVELYELVYDKDKDGFKMYVSDEARTMKGPEAALIETPEDT